MKEVTVEEFVKNFDEYMYEPENGNFIVIMEQGKAIARLLSMFRAESSKNYVHIKNG